MAGVVLLSLVAEQEGEIVGHILFSRIVIESDGALNLEIPAISAIPVVALAPMCVSSVHQKKGIGGALIQQGVRILRQRGENVIFVVGHKRYYQKFGFSVDLAKQFQCEYSGDTFLTLELQPGWIAGKSGTVVYPEAFNRLN